MRSERQIWILVLCLMMTAGAVRLCAQENQTDAKAKSAAGAAELKARRSVEKERLKAKRANEAAKLKAKRNAEEGQRLAKRANEIVQLKAKRAVEAEHLKVKRAIMVEQLKVRREAKPKAPPEGTFKLLGSRFNLDTLVKGASRLNLNKLVKGAPYSATAITEFTQTLPDGNQIIQRNEAAYYRDSEGRMRMEQTLKRIGKWVAAGDPKRIIMIADPVAGYSYSLDANEHKAIKSPLPNKVARPFSLSEETERQKLAWEKQRQEFERQRGKQRQLFEDRWEKQGRALEEQHTKPGQVSEEEWARQKHMFEEQRAKEKQMFEEQQARQKRRFEQEFVEKKQRFEEQLRRRQGLDGSSPNPEKSPPKPGRSSSSEEKRQATAPQSVNGKKTESLGKRVVEGVEAEGTRTTVTIAAGEIGNARPIDVIDERWYSQELQVPVMTRHHDPRSGDDVFRLANIKRSEPSRSLFEVPTDYTIVEGWRPKPSSAPGEPKPVPRSTPPNDAKEPRKTPEPMKPAPPSVQ